MSAALEKPYDELLALLSVREYVTAAEGKEAGDDWHEDFLERFVTDDEERALLLVYSDPIWQGKPVSDLCQAWMTKAKASRSSFYDKKRKLLSKILADNANVPLLGRLTLDKDDPG